MRKFKLICFSALAVLAISVVSVPAAHAAEGTAVVTGAGGFTATQSGLHTFTLPGGRVFSCGTRTFSGAIANGSKEITAAPTFHNCHVTVGTETLPATAEPTECVYRFYDLTTVAGNKYAAKTDIVCPAGQALHYKIYLNAENHSAGNRICEYTLKPQTELSGVTFTDNANNTINFNFVEVNLQVSKTFGTVGNCGAATFVSKYNGDTIATPTAGSTWDIDD